MAKTVSTLEFGDKLYSPTVENINEFEIDRIEKTASGIKIGTRNYYYAFDYSDFNAAISTEVFFKKRERKLYIRIEDARAKQKELQLAELKQRQYNVKIAIEKLNYFTLRYFTDDTEIKDINP